MDTYVYAVHIWCILKCTSRRQTLFLPFPIICFNALVLVRRLRCSALLSPLFILINYSFSGNPRLRTTLCTCLSSVAYPTFHAICVVVRASAVYFLILSNLHFLRALSKHLRYQCLKCYRCLICTFLD